MTSGFTDERVRAWVAATPRPWLRWVLVGVWVGAVVVSVASDTEPCSTADLRVCGPDLTFSVAIVLCFASVVLLWWRPFVAVACAVLFAIADLEWDTVRPANVAWTVVALVFVAYAVHLRSRFARQREIARAASVALPPWPVGQQRPLHLDGAHRLMAAGGVALVLVASGAVYGYQRAVAIDDVHALRAQVVEGVVLSDEDEDGNQKVRLEGRPEGFPAELEVLFIEVPRVNDTVALRVDPRDPSWTHPIAEPPDQTWWVSVGVGALLLAVLLAERLLAVRVRRRTLEGQHHRLGVPVRVFTDGLDFVGLLASDSSRGLGEFPVDEEVLRLATPEARRVAAPAEAFLVGDVRHGGWVALATPAGLRLPLGPLVALPEDAEVDLDTFDRDPEDPHDWSEPVPMGTIPVPLPVVVEAPLWLRAAGLAAAIAAVSVGMWLLWDEEVGVSGAGVVFGAGTALHWGLEQLTYRVRVASSGFAMRSVFSAMESPMGAVREVRVDEDVALVIFDDESVLEVVPPDGDGRGLAASIERAVESAPRVADGRPPRSGLPWTVFVFGAGMLTLAATWLSHWLA
ncbi:hypothetical protein ACOCJ7_00900 [Knoellia sp. CPCC 206453]|uniref:hypothetical protein n=1 Tax=Knoellia pratensis TaxID=3404796 RepID=UPI00361A14B1